MGDTTWSVRVALELKEKLQRLVEETGLAAKRPNNGHGTAIRGK